MSASYEVYNFLKDKVVWHDIERDSNDLPKDSFPVIAEGAWFQGIARHGYHGWTRQEGNLCVTVKRWAILPREIWTAYCNGYFNKDDNDRYFQTKEEFQFYANKAKRVSYEDRPVDAERVGYFSEEGPYDSYNATIYYKDNQYYLYDNCEQYALD